MVKTKLAFASILSPTRLMSSRWVVKLIAVTFTVLQAFGVIVRGEPPPSSPQGEHAAPPSSPTQTHAVVRQALRELDRFLDHHPLLEDDLRQNRELVSNQDYLKRNPELCDFLKTHPDALVGLKTFPRYFLYRALLRQASGPLRYIEIAQLKDVFDQQPTIERALDEKPELIRDPTFLQSHPNLREFLVDHPVLGKVFLPST